MQTIRPTLGTETAVIEAEPLPLQIDLQRMAVIVVDMQNMFLSRTGVTDPAGHDVSMVVENIKRINSLARARGVKVIYIAHIYSPDLREAGGLESPNWYKEHSLEVWRTQPEMRDKLIIRGTWGSEIIQSLKPEENDILVEKRRYSAFFGTDLDTILKTYNIKYLAFVGVATNVCVETSFRDSFNHGYFSVLISDGIASFAPSSIQEATVYNLRRTFGWVATTENLLKILKK